jgi:hypothetical protein
MTHLQVYNTHLAARPALAAVALCFASLTQLAHAADTPPTSAAPPHPIVGTWNWQLFGGRCLETLQYRAGGVMLSTSGDAVTEWRYTLDATPGVTGFYKVLETSVRQNGKKDCSGDVVDEAGTESEKFIQLSPAKDRLLVCKTESLAACYGPLQRVQ